ncbi:DNA polymerase/3'-5' exonuclease PolX [Jeotgalicoccus aerolatus]|uniref:DNA-directed DNA polymerase n=1 Tax=Jeotgalicoccus aerolatus TaxID=709510 RepID=A0A1G8VBL8_9STAP|nr:DNA polymerase/3'-5' exonuclease PolX [Jeotgalicoccus aerolatus]MBP1951958.1 DNA polymerase (family 10) [Jeotgalicoccus aerolatus]GGD93343.1 DNA polymerase/3'-5' exonuclease PolX [Jeotgalicoccus aerolatus]CAD2074812.1 DNA polymerase/3'-5' exonuclease PolX [Jeotgalicoccus aerolatus]SDJ63512.1 DNA polymerase (family 10) [Jeotgalicoccus aerolatus]
MTKKDVIRLLEKIAVYMELNLENPFKVSAYRKAAAALETDGRTLDEISDFSELKGIGKGTNDVITEFVQTGKSSVLKDLTDKVPPGLIRMLKLPTLGPKKIAKIHDALGIDTLEGLKAACENNEVSALSGFGKKTEENILKSIETVLNRPERYPINRILKFKQVITDVIDTIPGVERYDMTGSGRRTKETSRDLDFIVKVEDYQLFTQTMIEQNFVTEIVSQGDKKLSLEIEHDFDKINVDFRFVNGDEYISTLQHFTGSKEHNVKMRQIAKSRGEKISEYGVETPDGLKTFQSEEEFYHYFDLPYIPPAMRETGKETDIDISEIVSLSDIKGDLHMHTVYSDGANSIREMVEAAREKNYSYIVITDHSKSLRVANGLSDERLLEQLEEIRAIDQEYDDIDVYSGTEMDILADGTLDYSDEILSQLDYVIAAIHSSFQQSEEDIMHRLKTAMDNPYVRHIAHPTGRLIGVRDGYPVNMEELFDYAEKTNTILEINANPQRLDLSSDAIANQNVMFTVNTDAHHTDHLDFMHYGVSTLQKGFVKTSQVLNTLSREEFKAYINKDKQSDINE